MSYRSARRILAALLAVFVTVGASLSAVQASEMALQMAMTPDMAAAADVDCDGCAGDDGTEIACPPACVGPAVAVLPHALSVAAVPASSLSPRPCALATGRASLPDPYPPRSGALA